MSQDQHIVPQNDIKPHDTSTETGAKCACNPRIQVIGGVLVIIHNTYDDRETLENVQDYLDGVS